MRALMVQGTSSWAGKSLMVTALARHFVRRGLRVAPFKAQNMSNNARVVDGGEIGTAQYLQALAARTAPDVRMNPVLVKPEADDRSQVVVLGKVDAGLSRRAWRDRAVNFWPVIEDSLLSLARDFDLVLIEGAGSPTETNLKDCDLANMRVAERAGAPVLLVADIDRGGAFAHLYGTWALLEESGRRLLKGFILNKFRGDVSLLDPAPADLEAATGVPVIGVVPWLDHGLPDEDGAAAARKPRSGAAPVVAIVRYPTASNLDEFKSLEEVAEVRWARSPSDLDGAGLVVLPGSKHVVADLGWLRERGLDRALRRHISSNGRLVCICGGMQMAGDRLEDPAGVDGSAQGLGLLPITTVFQRNKITRRTEAGFEELPDPWRALSGKTLTGYEIRHGLTFPATPVREAISGGLGFVQGPVLGIYVHGLFESSEAADAILGLNGARATPLDEVFDELAEAVAGHLDTELLDALVAL